MSLTLISEQMSHKTGVILKFLLFLILMGRVGIPIRRTGNIAVSTRQQRSTSAILVIHERSCKINSTCLTFLINSFLTNFRIIFIRRSNLYNTPRRLSGSPINCSIIKHIYRTYLHIFCSLTVSPKVYCLALYNSFYHLVKMDITL